MIHGIVRAITVFLPSEDAYLWIGLCILSLVISESEDALKNICTSMPNFIV